MDSNKKERFNFSGKRALVTGASRGIGRQIATKLHEFGAHVVLLSRNLADLKKLENDLADADGTDKKRRLLLVDSIALDLGPNNVELWSNPEKLFDQILAPHMPFDFLINNAGVIIMENFLQLTPRSFDEVFRTNFTSALFLTQYVAKDMIKRGLKGSVVNISSQSSYAFVPDHTAYVLSKSSLDALTRLAAWELGPKGIRVNSVNPTVVMTDMGKQNWSDPAKSQFMLAKLPLGHFAEIDDVVNTVLFLLSEESRAITGANVPVDCGASVSF